MSEEYIKDEILHLENECLQTNDTRCIISLSKIDQMNWWKRIMFIFKGEFV